MSLMARAVCGHAPDTERSSKTADSSVAATGPGWRMTHSPRCETRQVYAFATLPRNGDAGRRGSPKPARLPLRLRLQRAGFRPRPVAPGAGAGHGRRTRRRRLDDGFAGRPLAHQQILDFVAGQRFEFKQPFGERFQIGALLGENLPRLGKALLNVAPDLGVDLLHRRFGNVLLACDRITEENFFLVFAVGDSAEGVGQ